MRNSFVVRLGALLCCMCRLLPAQTEKAIAADSVRVQSQNAGAPKARPVEGSPFSAGSASAEAADKIITLKKSWGMIVFYRGFPRSLLLHLCSGADLLPGLLQSKEYGQVQYREGGILYSTFHDSQMHSTHENGVLVFRGRLRNRQGSLSRKHVDYTLTWTISDLGYIKLDVCLQSQQPLSPGSVSYRFAFNGSNLNRYYSTGFQPAVVRVNTSLKRIPLDEISTRGTVAHFKSDVINRIIGFIRSETETLNFVPGAGFFRELKVTNTPPAVITYVDDTPVAFGQVRASFYLLPAPVREHKSLRRIFTAYFTEDRPIEAPGGVKAFLDTLSSYGVKDFIYHSWRHWNFTDATTEVSCLASDPERLKSLIREAHARNMRIILYVNLIPEEKQTVWYRKHEGGKWRTEHPFSLNMVGAASQRRDLMDLNSPFYEHRLRDIDYALDTIGADGIFVDWFTAFACSRAHAQNGGIPMNNINRLIDLISYVRGKGKCVYLHSSEEARIPFLENLADRYATGERPWTRVTSFSTARGLFDRWTASKGNMGVILDSRMAISDAEVREEVNWALLEGLNPFGYTYLVKWYALGPNVREQIAKGVPKASIRFHDTYPLMLLRALQPYDLESMTFLPAKEVPAQSDNAHVGVSAVTGRGAHILFAVNTDMVNAHVAQLRCKQSKLELGMEKQYKLVELTARKNLGEFSGKALIRHGFSVAAPANTCLLVAILDH